MEKQRYVKKKFLEGVIYMMHIVSWPDPVQAFRSTRTREAPNANDLFPISPVSEPSDFGTVWRVNRTQCCTVSMVTVVEPKAHLQMSFNRDIHCVQWVKCRFTHLENEWLNATKPVSKEGWLSCGVFTVHLGSFSCLQVMPASTYEIWYLKSSFLWLDMLMKGFASPPLPLNPLETRTRSTAR